MRVPRQAHQVQRSLPGLQESALDVSSSKLSSLAIDTTRHCRSDNWIERVIRDGHAAI
jgi:hypothetical protein